MRLSAPITRDLLLIGGGHAHAIALRRWGMAPLPGARVTLVNPDPSVLYTGMLPGYVAGHYAWDDLAIDLVKLARFAGARLVLDAVTGLDLVARRASLARRPPIEFDVVSINLGVTSEVGERFNGRATPAKPMRAFAAAWDAFIAAVRAGEKPPTAAVIGGGVGGVELAMAMAHRLRVEAAGAPVSVTLIENQPRIVPRAGAVARALLTSSLERSGVRTLTGAACEEARSAAFIAEAAGARPAPWLGGTGLTLESGFIVVDRALRSVSHQHVFAVGDAAAMQGALREKAGVYAVRQGPVLYHNLRAALSGANLRDFRPQGDHLKLVSLGRKSAVAEKWGLALRSPALWAWKDLIDRRFMRRLAALPAMAPPEPTPGAVAAGVAALEAADPLCGGCGSKVGRQALGDALARLSPSRRADTLRGAGDDAAVLAWGAADAAQTQVITSDHFRAFTLDPYALAQVVTQHALGDVWAMGASPQAGLASIVLPPMTPQKQTQTLAEILSAMQATLGEAGADLVGGHTSQGAELTLGLTITGLTAGRSPIGLGGARPGDLLLLTKPIGVGTVLAGEMRGLAKGDWVAQAFAQMGHSSAAAAALLRDEAHAMTDVTGFGLAGHLQTLLEASKMAAEVWLDAIAWSPGAIELSAAGVRSSLFAENARIPVSASPETRDDERFALLFDPQTAGGMLAAIAAPAAAPILDEFADAGQPVWVIGRIVAPGVGGERLTVRTTSEVADD
jgi:selenide,water dikinase